RRAAREVESADQTLRPFWRLGRARPLIEGALWLLIGIAIVVPLMSLIATSLVPALGVPLRAPTATLESFREVLFRQDVTRRAALNSLVLSATAAVLSAGLAIVVAYGIERVARRWRSALLVLIELPYAIPGIVLAIACILLFLRPLPLIGISLYGTPAIILVAYLARFQALALKPTLAAMALVSREPEEAAALEGATMCQRLRHVVIPSLAPAAVAGGLLVFLLALNELTVSALLWTAGTETLGVALMSLEDAGLASQAAALGVVATVLVALIMLAIDRIARGTSADAVPWASISGSR
ncbi:MAG TPA: ABC transporter permease subunit, partial [Hyphomicrobiaceae bacterium]|nr:ABC transporter permease subunit [Hyphomicrobiaceae bacterium]